MPVWGPILVFSELTAAFLSQTATGVILNHHQINYLCSLSPAFPFSPVLPLHHPLRKSHVLWINNQLLQLGRGHPWSAGREIQSRAGQSPETPGSPRAASPQRMLFLNEESLALRGRGHAHGSTASLWRCLICSLSQFLLAEGQWRGNASSQFPSDVIQGKVAEQLFKTLSLSFFFSFFCILEAEQKIANTEIWVGQNHIGRYDTMTFQSLDKIMIVLPMTF